MRVVGHITFVICSAFRKIHNTYETLDNYLFNDNDNYCAYNFDTNYYKSFEAYANVTSIRHKDILPKLSILTIIVFNVLYEKSIFKIIYHLILHQMQFPIFFTFGVTMTHTHIQLYIYIN